MSDGWFLVIDSEGQCRSMGTRVADPLPVGLEALPLSSPDAAAILSGQAAWSPVVRRVVPIPVPPPVPEVTNDQLRAWMAHTLGMSAADIDNAFREAARIA